MPSWHYQSAAAEKCHFRLLYKSTVAPLPGAVAARLRDSGLFGLVDLLVGG